MKVLVAVALFACVVFPVFSQDSNVPRYRQLSDSMESSVSSSTSTLENFDLLMSNNDHFNTYTSYRNQYNSLTSALKASEERLNKHINSNAPQSVRRDERNNYERLLKRLQAVKSEFDSWLQNIQ